jgi:hypothetical protein
MTRDAVTLYNSYYLIDTRAWLEQHTGTRDAEKSSSLQAFIGSDVFDEYQPSMDIAARTRLWCSANNLTVGGPGSAHRERRRTSSTTASGVKPAHTAVSR